MKSSGFNPQLQAVYLDVVEKQLQDNNPPETPQTFEKLQALGYNERDAKLLIASVIDGETYEIIKSGTPFNRDRFIRNLQRLPDQSFEEQ
ncbi:MAG: hypothetical protein HY277_09295 [Ignavibacteriales bacterium]|nr:hypothetical protein [Ignavibacteriales bacterium]